MLIYYKNGSNKFKQKKKLELSRQFLEIPYIKILYKRNGNHRNIIKLFYITFYVCYHRNNKRNLKAYAPICFSFKFIGRGFLIIFPATFGQ